MADSAAESAEALEARFNATHVAGKAVAMEVFAAKLRGWAGDAFVSGQDEKARWYRDVAERATSEAKLYRAEQERYEHDGR